MRTDGQTRTGTITLDECLFCNVIKNVKYGKTETKKELQKLNNCLMQSSMLDLRILITKMSYSVKVDIILSMHVSLQSSEGRMTDIHTRNNRQYNQSSQ